MHRLAKQFGLCSLILSLVLLLPFHAQPSGGLALAGPVDWQEVEPTPMGANGGMPAVCAEIATVSSAC